MWTILLILLHVGPPAAPALRIELGVNEAGAASAKWLAMIRNRVSEERYREAAGIRRPLSREERAWADLIQGRRESWEAEIPRLAILFDPVPPPQEAVIVLGNRGGEDAFVSGPTTIGFDLAALLRVYGDAGSGENRARIDRLFRHEYVHLLQKAWLAAHPYRSDSPLRAAVAEIWAEGLGNYFSMSDRWRARAGAPSETAAAALARLEPRFAARLAALACATPEQAGALTADLSNGPFQEKWGALPAALWLESDASRSSDALRRFVWSGPDGVWALARRHLPDSLGAVAELPCPPANGP